jgi:hypothetical protein
MSKAPPFLLWLSVAAFIAGLLHLFQIRYEAGDIYPPYSSLRGDPLGTMVLYEGLGRMSGFTVTRDFAARNLLPDGKATTYLHLAAERSDWRWTPEDLRTEIERFLVQGGRLVITFHPETSQPGQRVPDTNKKAPAQPDDPKDPSTQPAKTEKRRGPPESLLKEWGVEFGFRLLPKAQAGGYEPVEAVRQADLPLPPTMTWHSGMTFINVDPNWRTIYARGTEPVIIERSFGRGSVVMAADSYFLSNEAMRGERHPDLIAWVVGSASRVCFDEAHLGILERPGVATLMRRYRLHWPLAGLLLLAGLFIWRNSLGFPPPRADEEAEDSVPGREAASGLVNLLRRNIPERALLQTCFDEWQKAPPAKGSFPSGRLQELETLLKQPGARPPSGKQLVQAYQAICRAVQHPPATGSFHPHNPKPTA